MATEKTVAPQITQRILSVVNYMLENGMADNRGDAVGKIGADPSNASKLLSGQYKITFTQLLNLCEITGVSADYILGFSDVMMRNRPPKALDLLKEAVKAVENEMKKS